MKKRHLSKRTQRSVLITAGILALVIPGFLFTPPLPAQESTAFTSIQQEQESDEPETPAAVPIRRNVVKTKIKLEIAPPGGVGKKESDETVSKMLTQFIRIASIVEKRNKKGLYNSFSGNAKQRIARFLVNASAIETEECHKRYLEKLSENVLEKGNFQVGLPNWRSLEENRLEIIFPEDERYKWELMAFELFSNSPIPKNARKKGRGIEAVIYLNDPEETQKFEEYTDLVGKMEFNLPATAASRKKDVTYTTVTPAIKIAELIYTQNPTGFSRIFPKMVFDGEPDTGTNKIPGTGGFKIIIFKNLVNAYLEKVIKPVAAQVLSDERMWDVDYDSYISNLVMTRISHHLGPVFVLKFKDQEEIVPAGQQYMKRKPRRKKRKKKREKELKLVRDVLGDLFPVIETVKAQAIALHNTEVLIKNGLLPEDRDIAVYSTYLASLINDLRNNPPAMAGGQLGRKRLSNKSGTTGEEKAKIALIQFNHFLREEAVLFNISNQTLDIDRIKFREAAKTLVKSILLQLNNATYFTAEGFIQRNLEWPPQLDEIINKLQDIPLDVEFQLPEIIVKE